MRIDFHTHTTCSDGQYTPEELVQKAAAAGICALAITDHDAVSGIARGKQAAKAFPQLQIFPGIEISAKENPQLHILGYGIDGENADLQAYITRKPYTVISPAIASASNKLTFSLEIVKVPGRVTSPITEIL